MRRWGWWGAGWGLWLFILLRREGGRELDWIGFGWQWVIFEREREREGEISIYLLHLSLLFLSFTLMKG